MAIVVVCGECDKRYRVTPKPEQTHVRCPGCRQLLPIPEPAAEQPRGKGQHATAGQPGKGQGAAPSPGVTPRTGRRPPPPPPPASAKAAQRPSRGRSLFRWVAAARRLGTSQLLALSLLWVCLGFLLAAAMPWLGLVPSWLQEPWNLLCLLVTGGFLVGNTGRAVSLSLRTGKTLSAFPVTLVQFALFTLLFFQICCHLGTHHFDWSALPRWWDWFGFTVAHAIRAGDVCDILEAYGWKIQAISQNSPLTRLCLIGFHLFMGVFLIGLLADAVDWVKRRFTDRFPHAHVTSRWLYLSLAGLLVVWVVSAFIRLGRWSDILIWPVDNLVRVVDFVDAFEIYDVRLHAVPKLWWEATLTALCRVLLSLVLADSLLWLQQRVKSLLIAKLPIQLKLRWFARWGVSDQDLREAARSHPDPTVRAIAQQRLADQADPALQKPSTGWWVVGPGLVAAALLVGVLSVADLEAVSWARAASRLGEAACQADRATAARAMQSLGRMGWYARDSVPVIRRSFPALPPLQQLALIDVLGHLGPDAREALGEWVRMDDSRVALAAVKALGQMGPTAADSLVGHLDTVRSPTVREAALAELRGMGEPAVQPIIDSLTPANAGLLLPILDQMDAYYLLRSSRNPHWEEIRLLPRLFKQLASTNSNERCAAAEALGNLGPKAVSGIGQLIAMLETFNHSSEEREAAALALEQIGLPAIPNLIRALGPGPNRSYNSTRIVYARKVLVKIGSAAIPPLIKAMTDSTHDASSKAHALVALSSIDEAWARLPEARGTIPELVKMLDLQGHGEEVVGKAAQALGHIGPDAASAVSSLVTALQAKSQPVQLEVIRALGHMGPGAGAAMPALMVARIDGTAEKGELAAWALTKIDKNWPRSPLSVRPGTS